MKRFMVFGLGILLLCLTSFAASATEVNLSAIGIHTLSGKTMAGAALSFHVIPESDTNKSQDWCAKHLTLDVLTAGTAVDATSASLGGSLNLLSPEGVVKLGATYLWAEKEPGIYIGFDLIKLLD
jgi:hypothetical protein